MAITRLAHKTLEPSWKTLGDMRQGETCVNDMGKVYYSLPVDSVRIVISVEDPMRIWNLKDPADVEDAKCTRVRELQDGEEYHFKLSKD